jgi:phage shock protein E
MKTIIAFLFLVTSGLTVFGQSRDTIKGTSETSNQLNQKIKKGKVYLIDVRTPEEYKSGHLKYSTNIDFKSEDFKAQIEKLDKKKPVYLYCRTGNRSGKAADLLKTLGFVKYYNIGGFEDLKKAGLETVDPQN